MTIYVAYFYRDNIQRGSAKHGYRWEEGWSRRGKGGGVLYPWITKAEAKAEARKLNKKPVFIHEEKTPGGRFAIVTHQGQVEYVTMEELQTAAEVYEQLKGVNKCN